MHSTHGSRTDELNEWTVVGWACVATANWNNHFLSAEQLSVAVLHRMNQSVKVFFRSFQEDKYKNKYIQIFHRRRYLNEYRNICIYKFIFVLILLKTPKKNF